MRLTGFEENWRIICKNTFSKTWKNEVLWKINTTDDRRRIGLFWDRKGRIAIWSEESGRGMLDFYQITSRSRCPGEEKGRYENANI